MLGQKMLGQKKFKNFGFKRILGPKIFGVKKNFGSKEMLGP